MSETSASQLYMAVLDYHCTQKAQEHHDHVTSPSLRKVEQIIDRDESVISQRMKIPKTINLEVLSKSIKKEHRLLCGYFEDHSLYFLHLASYIDNHDLFMFFLGKYPDACTKKTRYGNLPLHLTAHRGAEELTRSLLGIYADGASIRNAFGYFPLHLGKL